MAEILSFYSVAPSQGKRTLSLAFANLLAEQQHKVLYVELDYNHPSVAVATQISHSEKNTNEYFHNTILKDSFEVDSFVLTKDNLISESDRDRKKIFSTLPGSLSYLVFPFGFNEKSFPNLIQDSKNPEKEAQEYIQKFIYSLKTSKYQYVVLNLPNELTSVLGYEVIANSDKILNVVTPSANRLIENKEIQTFLRKNIEDFDEKCTSILNMASPNINEDEYAALINNPCIVYYDAMRQKSELSLEFASPQIQEQLEKVAELNDISFVLKKKRSFFTRR